MQKKYNNLAMAMGLTGAMLGLVADTLGAF